MFARYHFRFSFLGSLLAVIGMSLFFSLGTWQINRASLKQGLQDKIDSRQLSAVLTLKSAAFNIEGKYYSPVQAVGHYDSKNEILIDSEVHQGVAGYHVLSPFILKQDQSVVMVNRGWVPVGRSRQVLPVLTAPAGELTVLGMLSPHKSKPALILEQANLGSSKVWAYFDAAVYASKTGYKLLPAVILMDQDKGQGYIRSWPVYDAKVSMHIGYAIQWYFFACVVFVTYFSVNLKKKPLTNVTDKKLDEYFRTEVRSGTDNK